MSDDENPDTLVILTFIVPLSVAPHLVEAMRNQLRKLGVEAVKAKVDMYVLRGD